MSDPSERRQDRRERLRQWPLAVRAVTEKQFLILFRYRVNFAAQLLGVYLFFLVVFYGGQAAVESAGATIDLGPTLDGLIVGWFTWTMSISAYSSLPSEITQESEWGTLEQVFISPHGFTTIMLAKAAVNIVQSVIFGGIVLAGILLVTGRTLTVDLITVVPLVVLGLCSLVGVGFAFAGLALVYKRVQSISSLMNFAIVGLIAAPAAGLTALRALPLVQASELLQLAMREGVRLWAFPATDLLLLLAVAVGYLAAGVCVFRVCSRVARKRGVMGHY